jgi:hypothetical protein
MNEALMALLHVLNSLGLRYFAVGSVASSIHGLPRFTQDVDLVVQLDQTHVEPIASLTEREFYMDRDEANRAVRSGRPFNLIHLATASKIDIFPMQQNEFHRSEMSRSSGEAWVNPGEGTIQLPVASAEDTILSKLIWYKQGGEVSDRQWSDLLGVATGTGRDWEYMRAWAPRLGVAELLERLFHEAGRI